MPSREALLRIIEIHSQVAQLGLDLAGVMSLSVHGTLDLVEADGAAIELAEGEELVYRAVAGAASHQLGVRVRRDGSLSGRCLRESLPLICDDTETDPRVDLEACRRVGLRSMVVLPLLHQGTPVGVLKAFSSRPARFGPHEIEVLALMSKVLGAAMYWATRYGRDDLFHRATHDDMTGLANRSLFMDRLRHATSEVERGDPPIAVLLLDMDGLKHMNDTLGHAAGDAAIIEFSRRLAGATRESDTVARLGGDEFAVLLTRSGSAMTLEATLERIHLAVEGPFTYADRVLTLRASMGAARCPEDWRDATALVECADTRMYEAKRARHGRDRAFVDVRSRTR
ncbi:MAG: GGDEF domain-containing protein [Mitsuaria chitosanitabida]|uniref:sensor domain-containing diguanylate cyclase n=1 Tax=Roseateles chitosanitabidus TaxID=65048 RepID=UPI001B045E75|nr:sensor domain-containing diguanylate cyclase [Roseateles chitosanitabidus]MBO9686066.1 GGDEF domain-containing protein [Roseateles chitosanitabidus]